MKNSMRTLFNRLPELHRSILSHHSNNQIIKRILNSPHPISVNRIHITIPNRSPYHVSIRIMRLPRTQLRMRKRQSNPPQSTILHPSPSPRSIQIYLLRVLRHSLIVTKRMIKRQARNLRLTTKLRFRSTTLVTLLRNQIRQRPQMRIPRNRFNSSRRIIVKRSARSLLMHLQINIRITSITSPRQPHTRVSNLIVITNHLYRLNRRNTRKVSNNRHRHQRMIPTQLIMSHTHLPSPSRRAISMQRINRRLHRPNLMRLPRPKVISIRPSRFTFSMIIR